MAVIKISRPFSGGEYAASCVPSAISAAAVAKQARLTMQLACETSADDAKKSPRPVRLSPTLLCELSSYSSVRTLFFSLRVIFSR